jgi:dihydrofolate reductase
VQRLVYSALCSLDGYTEDESGDFGWAAPDEEVHTFVNDMERPMGTYLFGRRMYETMKVWETMDTAGEPAAMADYADIWRAAAKIVFSTTLSEEDIVSKRTRLERAFDAGMIRELKAEAKAPIGIGGPNLASHALRAGLVDELNLILNPVIVGGGKPALPDGLKLELELAAETRFESGAVHLQYRVLA